NRSRHFLLFFFSSRRRHTRSYGDWSSDVCSSDLAVELAKAQPVGVHADILDRARRASFRRLAHEAIRLVRARRANALDLAGRKQIGRASCRERVESLGVGVAGQRAHMLAV